MRDPRQLVGPMYLTVTSNRFFILFILWELWGVRLAGKRAELVGSGWHVARFAELGAGVTPASGVNSTSKDPPVIAASCTSVAGLCGHGEPGDDVVGFKECGHSGMGWVGLG